MLAHTKRSDKFAPGTPLSPKGLFVLLLGALCCAVGSLCGTTFASAAPGNLSPPFDEGTSWNICQGYENNQGTHNGASRLSLDLTGSGCDSSASGKNVRSPITGVVSWYAASSGSLCVSANDGRSVMMTHINALVSQNAQVQAGDIVGRVAAPRDKQNNGVSHIHLQAWTSSLCNNSSTQVPFDSEFGTRICGAPNLPSSGPDTFKNGRWGSTKFTGDSCNANIPPQSPAVYRLYNISDRKHLYTTDVNEVNVLRTNKNWKYESEAYWVKSKSSCNASESVYRFYSETLKTHFYTTDENEKSVLSGYPSNIWRYEGVAYCTERDPSVQNRPIYRLYSEQLKVHLFTADENEKNELSKYPPQVWRYEGIAYYAYQD